ncbi:hypothetical protein [Streptomyces sp. SM13]|uniref:hypothetical protein n=1 Tax=Streptomyces sp. SM13 TaxID=1983803 RepID=UPI0015E19C9F|nr:hypothetical protein [Streptomyces sp. SM13]
MRGFADATPRSREEAEELAGLLERLAAGYREGHHGAPHPAPCLCHTCLVSPA